MTIIYPTCRFPLTNHLATQGSNIQDSKWVKALLGTKNIQSEQPGYFPGWKVWSNKQTGLSTLDKCLVQGPTLIVDIFNKAELGGVTLGCKHIESTKKAVNSIIMVARDTGDHEKDKQCGGISVGRILSFISHMAPGSSTSDSPTLIADVEWFDTPVGDRHWNKQINCPVVKKSTRKDPGGDFYPVVDIYPTKLMLVPHIPESNSLWQVLHTDSDFIRRFAKT